MFGCALWIYISNGILLPNWLLTSFISASSPGYGVSACQRHHSQGPEVEERVLWRQQGGHHRLWPVWDVRGRAGGQVGADRVGARWICVTEKNNPRAVALIVTALVLSGGRMSCGYLAAGYTTWPQRLWGRWAQKWTRTSCRSPRQLMFTLLGMCMFQ